MVASIESADYDPRAVGMAWTDLMMSLPEGAQFDRADYYGGDGDEDPAGWTVEALMPDGDRCQHVEGCRHQSYRHSVVAHGTSLSAALSACASQVRLWVEAGA